MDKPNIPKSPNKDKPNIPKSPASKPAAILGPSPKLNRSKSEQKFSSKLDGTPQKRVRLRDYLFIASTSSQRNNEKKQDLIHSIIGKEALRSSISALKRNKYGLPNNEMYDIVKREIIKEFTSIISDIQGKLQALKAQQVSQPTADDLKYLYNIKRITNDSIRPAIREMDDLAFRHNGNVIKEIISIGLQTKNVSIKEEKEDEQNTNEKHSQDQKGTLSILSLIFAGKQKQ